MEEVIFIDKKSGEEVKRKVIDTSRFQVYFLPQKLIPVMQGDELLAVSAQSPCYRCSRSDIYVEDSSKRIYFCNVED